MLRPLLAQRRADVVAYLEALRVAEAGLEPLEDPSNRSLDYARNRVRREVLPELRAINPLAVEAIARFAESASDDDAALDAWAAQTAEGLRSFEDGAARLDRRALCELPVGLALRVLRRAALEVGMHLDRTHAEAVLEIAGRRGARADLRGGAAWTDAESLWLRGAGSVIDRQEPLP